jgi:hypothetical protein
MAVVLFFLVATEAKKNRVKIRSKKRQIQAFKIGDFKCLFWPLFRYKKTHSCGGRNGVFNIEILQYK